MNTKGSVTFRWIDEENGIGLFTFVGTWSIENFKQLIEEVIDDLETVIFDFTDNVNSDGRLPHQSQAFGMFKNVEKMVFVSLSGRAKLIFNILSGLPNPTGIEVVKSSSLNDALEEFQKA